METIQLENNTKVMYTTAESFPEGIMDAHERLHKLVPFSETRKYYGISRPENGSIIYRAATEEKYSGEAEKYHLETLILKKGTYTCITVNGFKKDTSKIGEAFDMLLKNPDIDPEGYCVEWYYTDQDSVKCLVRLVL